MSFTICAAFPRESQYLVCTTPIFNKVDDFKWAAPTRTTLYLIAKISAHSIGLEDEVDSKWAAATKTVPGVDLVSF